MSARRKRAEIPPRVYQPCQHPDGCRSCGAGSDAPAWIEGEGASFLGEAFEIADVVPPECSGCGGTGYAYMREVGYRRPSGRRDMTAKVVTCAACRGLGYRTREKEQVHPRDDPFRDSLSGSAGLYIGWNSHQT